MGCAPSLHLYKGTPRGEFDTSGLREFLRRDLLSFPHHAPPLSLLPLSLMWILEGLRRSEDDSTATRLSAAGIPDRIQTDLLPQSRLDPDPDLEGVIMHRTCTSTTRCCTRGTMSLRRCCRTGVVAPWRQDLHDLEVGYVVFIVNACAGA
jgi:hypothetical protein